MRIVLLFERSWEDRSSVAWEYISTIN